MKQNVPFERIHEISLPFFNQIDIGVRILRPCTQTGVAGTSGRAAVMVGCIITAPAPSNIRFPNRPIADIGPLLAYKNGSRQGNLET